MDYQNIRWSFDRAVQSHDHILETRGPISNSHRTFKLPFSRKLQKKKKYREAKKIKTSDGTLPKIEVSRTYVPLFNISGKVAPTDNFLSVCRNGSIGWRSPEMSANLRCRLQHHSDPWLRIGPLKMEEMSDFPFVVVFRNFLTPNEADYMTSLASDKLERSKMGTTSPKVKRVTGNQRTSKQAWISDLKYVFPVTDSYRGEDGNGTFKHIENLLPQGLPHVISDSAIKFRTVLLPKLWQISLRIGAATRLKIGLPFSDEIYQVANYGMGGQYINHIDPRSYFDGAPSRDWNKFYNSIVGDRIATFMAYLSDVKLGGGTAFPLLGLRTDARQGDAVFWFNLLSTGKIDRLTNHGGCPVLMGSKWITNKWITYHDQALHNYPCHVEPSRFQAFQSWRNQN